MKKITYSFKMALLALGFLVSYGGFSQCVSAFNYTLNPAGNVSFNSVSTSTPANVIYAWMMYGNNTVQSFTAANPSVTFSVNGTYTVILSIYNQAPQTCSASSAQLVVINNTTTPCNLNANININTNSSPMIGFSASPSTGTVPGSTYSWNYGDNTTGTVISGPHTYSANGIYTVTLLVNNNVAAGTCTSLATNTIQICGVNPIQPSFIYSIDPSGVVTLTSTSTNTTSGNYYSWTNNNTSPNNVSGINMTQATFSFSPCNSCGVWLQITDTISGCVSTAYSQSIIPNNANPCALNASFSFTQSANGQVNAMSTSTGITGNSTYVWNFGDGSPTVGGTTAGHSYASNGSYVISLTVTNPTNNPLCTSTYTQLCTISNITVCVADASFSLAPSGTPQFWNAYPASPGNVTSAEWQWGDGSTSNTLFTSHTYSAAGIYSICLSVTVNCGSTDTYCTSYNIFKSANASDDQTMVHINVIDASAVGIKTNQISNMECAIFPSPNSGVFEVSFAKAQTDLINVMMYDAVGKLVYSDKINTSGGTVKKTISVPELSNGIYYLKLTTDQSTVNQKVVISK